MLQDLREIMGLTIEQVADELSLSAEQVTELEQKEDKQYSRMFFSAFPVSRRVLRYPDADPFLPSYDQTSPGKRLGKWMLENKINASDIARVLGMTVEDVLEFMKCGDTRMTRARGEEIERLTGINRKWLMYGDGRNKGRPSQAVMRTTQEQPEKKTLFEQMAAAFEQLPDERVLTAEEERQEKKELGRQVRDARKNAGMSLKQAAEVLNLSASRVGQLECGIITRKKAEEVFRLYADYTRRMEASSGHGLTDRAEEGPDASSRTGLYWGERIREARKALGFSQQRAGDLIGMSHATISLMEKGKVTQESAENLLRLMEENRRK